MEEDTSASSHPYYVRAEFPFVFIPARDFTYTSSHLVDDDDEQMTSKVLTEKKTTEDEEEIVEDEVDQSEENVEEKNDLRISQPKYSQLLKDLDFSQTRMVDVTNLLSDDGGNYLTADENEIPKKTEEKYQSLSSAHSSTSNDDQKNFTNAAQEIENDLNHLADIIQEASQIPTEDDDTSKQATQNYDLNDHEQEPTSKTNNENLRFTTGDEPHLSSIPRLNTSVNHRTENPISWEDLVHGSEEFIPAPTFVIISQPMSEPQTTPIKEQPSPREKARQNVDTSPKVKLHYRSRQLSSSSDGDSIHQTKSTEDDRKKSHRHFSTDTWLAMLEKLEQEHKERLERQQKQYEEYMRHLEEKMKQRLDQFISSSTNLQQSKSDIFNSSYPERYESSTNNYQYRPLARDLNGSNLSRTHSREDISNLRTELSTKHAKHISDLKSYYEDEIGQLKSQLNHQKMGHTSSTTRQSMETIERINNENIRLHDEMKGLRQTLKKMEDDSRSSKRQIDELREQLKAKDIDLKNSHQEIIELERQLNEARSIKDRQDEQFRYLDRQALFYKQENEKTTNELNLTRERLARLEERYRELENDNKTHRLTATINDHNHSRIADDLKMNSIMSMNVPTSREYGRFTLMSSKYSSSTVTSPRETNLDSGRLTNTCSEEFLRRDFSPRSLTKISDYLNQEPTFSQSRPLYSPRKSPPTEQIPARDFIESQMKHSDDLEEKFDKLLKTKRDLESRINRIPTRGLTNTDRQLLEVLEREIDRVEQQISSVKLELRKLNILRTH